MPTVKFDDCVVWKCMKTFFILTPDMNFLNQKLNYHIKRNIYFTYYYLLPIFLGKFRYFSVFKECMHALVIILKYIATDNCNKVHVYFVAKINLQ